MTQITYPGGTKVNYAYDSADRLTGVTAQNGPNPMTLATLSDYLPFGPYSSLVMGNGVSTSILYDSRYKFDGQVVSRSTQTLMNHDYGRDASGNITSINNLLDATWGMTYVYDPLYKLKSATRTGPPAVGINYTYDSVGNRLTEGGGLGSSTYTYTGNLLSYITGAKARTFSYNANGNAVTEGNRAYVYDQNNRLSQVTESSITVGSYVYDGYGRRVKKAANGETVYYLYDQYDRLMAEINQTGQLTVGYVHLPDRPLIKADISGGVIKLYYYHTDHLGTPQFMTGSGGQKVWGITQLPFGETYQLNEDVDGDQIKVINNIRFPGQYYDKETGLHYNMARDYNPKIGRYIESDQIGLAGGINTYAYVGNNPVNWIDPWGLLKYNTDDTSKTGRLSGDTLTFAECLEKCANFELTVTGGSEKTGHTEGSKHYTGEACDFSEARNPKLDQNTVKKCFNECAKDNYFGQKEGGQHPHWHFQIVPGLGGATGLQ